MTDAGAPVWGGQSMTAPLREVLIHRPDAAFGAAFDNPAHGFYHPVDLLTAQREHDAYLDLLLRLGVHVHALEAETDDPDLVYTYDPLLVTDAGSIALRPGKPNRRVEPPLVEAWTTSHGIPIHGRIEPPGTVEGGDTLWLRPDLFCIGRSLRTNDAGAHQLASLIDVDVRIFDLPYWHGPAELVHTTSLISLVTDQLAVVYPPLFPAGLWELLAELAIATIAVPDDEYATLGCNVLTVRPGVLVMAEGNPQTRRALESAGCEVHTYPATEIGLNGSGGPTCMPLSLSRDVPTGPAS
ncbi:MAG: arginine deiminase family protein [Actinomycetota bacterium]|nr:arginine deiminase family protein [Actinomycetota bacterium]